MNPKDPIDFDGAEISWFAPLCDGDDDFLGNRNWFSADRIFLIS